MLVVPYLLLIYIVLVVVGMMLVLDFWVCSIGIDKAWREKKTDREENAAAQSWESHHL